MPELDFPACRGHDAARAGGRGRHRSSGGTPLTPLRRRGLAFLFAGLFPALRGAPARAHGDDHPAGAGTVVIAPRAEARVGTFELVAVFSKQTLAVFLNRFDDAAPVVGARIEAATDLQSATLVESDPGVYVTTELLLASGSNAIELTLTLAGATLTQGIAIVLPSEAPADAAPPATGSLIRQLGTLGGSAVLTIALAAGGIALARRSTRAGGPA